MGTAYSHVHPIITSPGRAVTGSEIIAKSIEMSNETLELYIL